MEATMDTSTGDSMEASEDQHSENAIIDSENGNGGIINGSEVSNDIPGAGGEGTSDPVINNPFNKTPNFSTPPPFRHINPFARGGGNVGGRGGGIGTGGGVQASGRSNSEQGSWQPANQNTTPAQVNTNGPPPQIELWVETKTEDGKSYYYHAITRETTWNKPEGLGVRIMTQVEIEEMNKKQQQQAQPQQQQQQIPPQQQKPQNAVIDTKPNDSIAAHAEPLTADAIVKKPPTSEPVISTSQPPPNMLSQPPPQLQAPPLTQPPPNIAAVATAAPPMTQQPPPFFPPPGGMHQPPNFGQMPFGMPPPGYGGFPGAPPAAAPAAPWGMPAWNQQHMHAPPPAATTPQEKPAKNLIIKPGVIDPAVIARAAEWSEHRAPDGRPYYYHAARGESVWEKPQALRDMEAARMAAHSGATPQQAVAAAAPTMPPHLMSANPLMHHMPPAAMMQGGFDPAMAYNAAAAAMATLKANENSKAAQAAAALEKEKKAAAAAAAAAEEKRKKEEEQKKASGANSAANAKPIDKSRPISSTPIAGTPWCVVWTGDARVFFYNPSTRTSVWERPEDLLDRADVDKAVSTTPEQLRTTAQTAGGEKEESQLHTEKSNAAKEAAMLSNSTAANAASTVDMDEDDEHDDNEVIKIRTESDSSFEEVPTKKSRLARKSDANEAVVEAEVRAAKERAVVPLETRIKQFKEMLREKDVSAFSTWEKELHKIVFDPRYLLLTSKERKQVFEKYVKDRAEEERKEKRNKMRQKREDFRKLMEEAKLHGKSSFSEFCQRFGKEERYKAIEKVRERESLFNEYIVDVRRREKEEKQQRKEQIRHDFIEMLRDRSDIDRHTRWHDIKKKFESDSRYRAVESSGYREEYFLDYVRELKDEKRRQREQKDREREKERERERRAERSKSDRKDRERSGRSDRDKDRERDRDRDGKSKRDTKEKDSEKSRSERDKEKDKDKDKERKEERKRKHEDSEEGEHHDDDEDGKDSRHSASDDDETERLQKERDRQLRAEQSLREREKEVQRTMAGVLRDRDKEREHHKRDEAIGHFNALLTDLVRNADLTWKEVKRQLRKDHRWELVETLDREDREKIFNDHIDNLMKKKREKFREMLDEISTLELTSSWKDIKKLIKEDPRYLKYNNSEKCEREFRDHIKDKTLQAKAALRELLQECKLITHKTIDLIKENPNHLKEIQDILKNDKRFLILEHMEEERSNIVVGYLEELHKRGPPPPPTASESTRRHKN